VPRFQILRTDQSFSYADIDARDASRVLHIVARLDWKEADVLRDGLYCFSVRTGSHGMWTIFQRGTEQLEELSLAG
jgi:hypothetical protein